jgi:cytokinin riboside 5'-monophosphate phosphoribohydrolase
MNICVFCSSSNAVEQVYFEQAALLGRELAMQGHHLVYGGSNVGLMRELARSVKQYGGKVTGIIPERIHEKGLACELADEIIITRDMSERKQKMAGMADAFVALPGGFGTLEEILEMITLKQLQYHNKPIVFVNSNGFYNHLFQLFEQFYREFFAKNDYRTYYHVVESSGEVLPYVLDYTAPDFRDKWYWVDAKDFGKNQPH